MSTLSELMLAHGRATEADIEWLHLLVADGQLIADLAFADIVLWVPTDAGSFVAYSVGLNNRDDHGQLTREIGRDVGRVRPGMSRATVEGDFGLRITAR